MNMIRNKRNVPNQSRPIKPKKEEKTHKHMDTILRKNQLQKKEFIEYLNLSSIYH
jgi:hypothetical protein